MAEVTLQDLRARTNAIIDRAAAGEAVTITRGGMPVAELRASPAAAISATGLLAGWQSLPHVDPVALRADISATIDASA